MRTITRAEQETIIRWDAEEQVAHVDTANPATIRKLDKLVAEFPDAYRCVREDAEYPAKRYAFPARYVRFGKPPSEAQREAGRAAAARIPKTSEQADLYPDSDDA